MSCLKNYILLDGVIPVTPNSGLYMNRELTIPLEHVSSVVSNSQVSLDRAWDEIQEKAIKKFIIRVQLGYIELFQGCSVDEAWICTNKALLAMPLVYFLGSETMAEIKFTNRINRYTTIDKARAGELRDEFDREFQIQLKAALVLINKSGEQKEEMGDVFSYVEVLP